MQNVLGEFDCKVDSKGRMRLPTPLLKQLGVQGDATFVVHRGPENYLIMYTREAWDAVRAKVDKLNYYNPKHRQFIRYFYGGATYVNADSTDRILFSKRLLEYAGIEKEVILSAMHNKIEIWAQDRYDQLFEQQPVNYSDLSADVMGGGGGFFNPFAGPTEGAGAGEQASDDYPSDKD